MKHIQQKHLERYADLLLEVGLNVQKGDKIKVGVSPQTLEFVRAVDERAWKLGAVDVHHSFQDSELTKNFYNYASDEAIEWYPEYEVVHQEEMFKAGYHVLGMSAPNPLALKSVDPKVIGRRQAVVSPKTKRLMKYTMENRNKWCVAIVPTQEWADAVFPGDPDALTKLTDLWVKMYRLDEDNCVELWREHNRKLKAREAWLNEMDFDYLIYEAPGTDLTVGLAKGHRWIGGSSNLKGSGEEFMANMPTEEVFTMPDKYRIDGTLKATKALNVRGKIVDGMRFVFKGGRLESFEATENYEVLEDLLNTDENARRLGEVAIVSVDSPINQAGVLFLNTLLDENASCHFAFGNAYAENLPGSENFDEAQQDKAGMNDSAIHVDFMVGSDKLNIIGVKKDGTRVDVLKNGEFVGK
ncbi:MAG: aminopeptidase [Bacillota bacterium]|nr:aminopeptidase [Bacillota bacterium]